MIRDATGSQKETLASLGTRGCSSVLDVGCGDGGMTRKLLSDGQWMAGIDPDPQSIRDANATHAQAALFFAVGTAEALCFSDGMFHAVVFNQSLHHVPVDYQPKALAEAHRVLAPGGTLLVLEPISGSGTYNRLLVGFGREKPQKEAAIRSVTSVIDWMFRLVEKEEVQIFYQFSDMDDLCHYASQKVPDWGRRAEDQDNLKSRLTHCQSSPDGGYCLDYSATVWRLVKI